MFMYVLTLKLLNVAVDLSYQNSIVLMTNIAKHNQVFLYRKTVHSI